MGNDSLESRSNGSNWKAAQVYTMAAICLVLGVALGYLFRGSNAASPAVSSQTAQAAPPAGASGGTPQMPTLEQMKQVADTKAEPLLAKLKTDPNNADLLIQIGKIYESTHQFKDAADYYQQSLKINPKNVATRTELASCLYYTGDADGAIGQLQQSLKDDPKNADSLFNLGMIRWRGKNDVTGALTAWEQLLKSNPNLEANKRTQVEKLIADARQHGKTGQLQAVGR